MKFNKKIILLSLPIAVALLVSIAFVGDFVMQVHSQENDRMVISENDEAVVLVHLVFENNEWFLGPDGVLVLPCAAPSKFIFGRISEPLIRILDAEKIIREWHMRNPRVTLVEDPKTLAPFLEKVSFKLRFALVEGIDTLEFWYDPIQQKQPSVVVDLKEAIDKFWDAGGPDQKADCQPPKWEPREQKPQEEAS